MSNVFKLIFTGKREKDRDRRNAQDRLRERQSQPYPVKF